MVALFSYFYNKDHKPDTTFNQQINYGVREESWRYPQTTNVWLLTCAVNLFQRGTLFTFSWVVSALVIFQILITQCKLGSSGQSLLTKQFLYCKSQSIEVVWFVLWGCIVIDSNFYAAHVALARQLLSVHVNLWVRKLWVRKLWVRKFMSPQVKTK